MVLWSRQTGIREAVAVGEGERPSSWWEHKQTEASPSSADSQWPTWVQLPKHPFLPAWSPAKLSDSFTLQEEGLALPWEFPDLQGLFLGH